MVKRVRIQSPVISPDEPHEDPFDARLNDQGHSGSPPPPDDEPDVAAELRRSFIDSVARGASNLNPDVVGDVPPQSSRTGLGTETTASRVAQQQPLQNTAMEQFSNNTSLQQSTYSPGPQQAPYNPFARTLASIEGNYMKEEKSVEDVASEQVGQGTGKAAMDVDSFTRMLLTGKPALTVPSSQAAPGLLIPTDGSSTENSSISRHTLSDSSLGIHLESPRSSYEDSRSEGSADATEHSSLVRDAQPKKAKPPPPANHRGKLLSKKGPQTVSFADFDIAVSPDSAQNSPASPSLNSSRLSLSRSPSDLNKPLPPPPSSNIPDSGLPTLPSQPFSQDDITRSSKIAAPPPPVPRRTSSTRVEGLTSRPRSGSQLSKSSFAGDFEDSPPSLTSSLQAQPGKPPPPPTRRPLSIIPSIDREASVSSQASTAKAPPPPPSRQSLRGTTTLTRTPSTQSTASIGHRRISPSLSGPTPPPPPPPRRGDKRSSLDGTGIQPGPTTRRPSDGSQRSSIELRRSSNTSLHHGRPSSISSLQYVGEAGEDGLDTSAAQITDVNSGKDILADLSAFQAEIDALRAQIGR